jgi:hypothetical protein
VAIRPTVRAVDVVAQPTAETDSLVADCHYFGCNNGHRDGPVVILSVIGRLGLQECRVDIWPVTVAGE